MTEYKSGGVHYTDCTHGYIKFPAKSHVCGETWHYCAHERQDIGEHELVFVSMYHCIAIVSVFTSIALTFVCSERFAIVIALAMQD